MSRAIILDTSPLGLLTNPKLPPETVSILAWAVSMRRAGNRFIVPAIADYEVRLELERAGKVNGIAALDAWNNVVPDRYFPLTDSALRLGACLRINSLYWLDTPFCRRSGVQRIVTL